jgi:hypothetical protein
MKEQTLIEMKNKLDAIVRVLQTVMDEQQHLTSLSVGTLQAIKLMPGYDEAIKQLTEKAQEKKAKSEEISNELLHAANNAVIVEEGGTDAK